jgi:sugar phosphate isomerase/epimerase
MKLAVSNIAWQPADRDAAYAILRDHGIDGLEIAPGLFFDGAGDPFVPTIEELSAALAPMERAGLRLVSMQSLLFGVAGAALFEGETARERLVAAMMRAIGLAERLSIPNLVFGSPRQRVIPADMTNSEAEEIAVATFRRLGDAAARARTCIAIEANPEAYGTNFLNRVAQAEAFVRQVDHEAIRLIVDVGALHMNGDFEQIEDIAVRALDVISHVHMSEPDLAAAPADIDQAARIFCALAKPGYRQWISIEMRAPESMPLKILEQSVARLARAAAIADAGTRE